MIDVFNQAYQLLNQGGLMAGLIIAVVALAKEWVVPGSRYQAVQRRVEELERRLDVQMQVADKAISAADTATRAVERGHA